MPTINSYLFFYNLRDKLDEERDFDAGSGIKSSIYQFINHFYEKISGLFLFSLAQQKYLLS